jgi:hypothetical protein
MTEVYRNYMHKNKVGTSQRTQSASTRRTSQLITLTKRTGVYREKQIKHTHTHTHVCAPCAKMQFLNVTAGDAVTYRWVLRC